MDKINDILSYLMDTKIMLVVIVIVFIITVIYRKEDYVNLTYNYSDFADMSDLNKDYVGIIGTRKDFQSMKKPFLNARLEPVIPEITE